jgi:hypothetical protein
LANHLQGIALLVLAGNALAADFSHRAHLALKLECTTCHASVTTSSRVEDNNLPKPEACIRCHNPSPAIKKPREAALAHFPHSKHVGTIQCLTCHKGINTSEVTGKANLPPMAQCVTCHNQTDIPDSCYFCHAKTMNLEPAGHGEGFVDAHSRVHRDAVAKQSCQMCHGRNFHCAGCH